MIRINNIKVKIGYKEQDILQRIKQLLHVKDIKHWRIARRSIDSRDKNNIKYVISVEVALQSVDYEKVVLKKVHNNNIMLTEYRKYEFPYHFSDQFLMKQEEASRNFYRPIIIGAGPAGYFAALKLAEAGYRPILFERGRDVDARSEDVEAFWQEGIFTPSSNVSFGEGGAGTFSDGKLNTGIKDKTGRITDVLENFCRFGAEENILYDAKPHVGTDVLKCVMKNMRHAVTDAGGDIYFSSFVSDLSMHTASDGIYGLPVYKVTVQHSDGSERGRTEEYYSYTVILAIGHSARDTFQMLYDRGFQMEQKPFAVGLRIEHKRTEINRARYGESEAALKLPAADYKLTHHAENGRAVFSFCMCPGGYVVNASGEEGCMVVNGMSYSKRDAENSNSAIVCSVTPADYPGPLPMDAVEFQRELEQKFYAAGGGRIPVQTYGDFKAGRKTEKFGEITPCMKGKFTMSNLKECLPEFVSDAIIEGIEAFERQIEGFSRADAVLSGIESRTSSPIRILRNEHFMSNYPGIIPCGEGAGYAGGITSAAVDGMKAAEACAAYLSETEKNERNHQR